MDGSRGRAEWAQHLECRQELLKTLLDFQACAFFGYPLPQRAINRFKIDLMTEAAMCADHDRRLDQLVKQKTNKFVPRLTHINERHVMCFSLLALAKLLCLSWFSQCCRARRASPCFDGVSYVSRVGYLGPLPPSHPIFHVLVGDLTCKKVHLQRNVSFVMGTRARTH